MKLRDRKGIKPLDFVLNQGMEYREHLDEVDKA